MARIFFDRFGVVPTAGSQNPIATRTVTLGTTSISNGVLILTNDSDSTVRGTIAATAGVTIGDGAAGETYSYTIQAKSFTPISYEKTSAAGTAILGTGAMTSHGTSTAEAEHVYLFQGI